MTIDDINQSINQVLFQTENVHVGNLDEHFKMSKNSTSKCILGPVKDVMNVTCIAIRIDCIPVSGGVGTIERFHWLYAAYISLIRLLIMD